MTVLGSVTTIGSTETTSMAMTRSTPSLEASACAVPDRRSALAKKKQGGPNFNEIMDSPCDYHSLDDPSLPRANHTNEQCYWHKLALREANKNKGDNDDDRPDPAR